MSPAETRPRGRPRDESVDSRVLAAAVEELAEKGIAEFSITATAARAHAAKRSIYARWSTREALILDAMSTLAAGLTPPRTGTLAGDLTILLDQVAAVFVEPRRSVLQRCAAEIAEFPDLAKAFKRDSVDRCLAALEDALYDAAARGEIRRDIDTGTAAEMLTGAVILRGSFGVGDVLPAALRQDLIQLLIEGLRPDAS